VDEVLNERQSTGGRHSTITSCSRGEATRRLRATGFVPPDAAATFGLHVDLGAGLFGYGRPGVLGGINGQPFV